MKLINHGATEPTERHQRKRQAWSGEQVSSEARAVRQLIIAGRRGMDYCPFVAGLAGSGRRLTRMDAISIEKRAQQPARTPRKSISPAIAA
jgi:hypothetical protein